MTPYCIRKVIVNLLLDPFKLTAVESTDIWFRVFLWTFDFLFVTIRPILPSSHRVHNVILLTLIRMSCVYISSVQLQPFPCLSWCTHRRHSRPDSALGGSEINLLGQSPRFLCLLTCWGDTEYNTYFGISVCEASTYWGHDTSNILRSKLPGGH